MLLRTLGIVTEKPALSKNVTASWVPGLNPEPEITSKPNGAEDVVLNEEMNGVVVGVAVGVGLISSSTNAPPGSLPELLKGTNGGLSACT